MSLKDFDSERESDHWATPNWLKATFSGWFDPCPINGSTDDGLRIAWGGKTFVNPPYSDPLPWVVKAIQEARKGKTVVMLVKVDPSTEWWLRLVATGSRFAWFIHDGANSGRLSFSDRNKAAAFPSALVFLP